jgi:dTDP-4-dehydrorhamnose reductase
MKVIILGVSGLIGHKLFQELSASSETFGVLHRSKSHYNNLQLFSGDNVFENIDVIDFEILEKVFLNVNPDVILNCVGITKRKDEISNSKKVIAVNSLFPHLLADWAKTNNKRVIHFSTDCVFNGAEGNYNESSLTTAEDFYGRTKALGEIMYEHTLTLRSSFIGQELFGKTELLEWFIAQRGKQISGYTKTYYSGVSTIYLSKVVRSIISDFPNLSGLYHLAPESSISKYELLCLARDAYKVDIKIMPDDQHVNNPTLDASKLRKAINICVPSWNTMMEELAANKSIYTNVTP